MLGLVTDNGSGLLRTHGVLGSQCGAVDPLDLKGLIAGGHAVNVSGPAINYAEVPVAALWIGAEFLNDSERHRLKLPPIPKQMAAHIETGTYWIAPTQHVWRVIDSWVISAFRQVVETKDSGLAALMAWALPERDETAQRSG